MVQHFFSSGFYKTPRYVNFNVGHVTSQSCIESDYSQWPLRTHTATTDKSTQECDQYVSGALFILHIPQYRARREMEYQLKLKNRRAFVIPTS